MSWLSKIFTGIEHGAVIVGKALVSPQAAAIESAIPFVSNFAALIRPELAAIINKGNVIVTGVEGLITTAKTGALKHETAVQIATEEIPQLEEVIKAFGVNVAIPQAELKDMLDASVNFYNRANALLKAIEAANKPA